MDYKTPLTVSMVWNQLDYNIIEKSVTGLSSSLSRDLNKPFSRNLDVPLYYFGRGFTDSPPLTLPPCTGQVNIVVMFASLNTASSDAWREYFKTIKELANIRVVVVSIDEYGLNHSADLGGDNFLRGYEWSASIFSKYCIAHILHELYRFAFGIQPNNTLGLDSSICLFLSHAKLDEAAISITEKIIDYIQKTNFKHFFDKTAISPGFSFAKEIEGHIETSTVLAIVTDNYSSRYWCQREIIAAQDMARPIVILNALEHSEDRAFPELSNAPVMHLTDHEKVDETVVLEIVCACLTETIRHNYSIQKLLNLQRHGMVDAEQEILSKPLNYRGALKNLEKGISCYCYPDPPVYAEESSWHDYIGIEASTPLWNCYSRDSFKEVRIGISISEISDNDKHLMEYHLPDSLINKLSQELARHCLARAATLVYGGDLRNDGITNFILNEAAILKDRTSSQEITLENHVAWPIYNFQKQEQKQWIAKHHDIVKFYNHEPPQSLDVNAHEIVPPDTAQHRMWWSLSLTLMRKKLVKISDFRICAGGRRSGYKGSMPGVLEEVLLSLNEGAPLYLFGGFGGIVSDICSFFSGTPSKPLTKVWQIEHTKGYDELLDLLCEFGEPTDYVEIRRQLSEIDLNQLAENAGLTRDEYLEMMSTNIIEDAIRLFLKGSTLVRSKRTT